MKIMKYLMVMVLFSLSLNVYSESVWDKETPALENPPEMVVYRSPTCGCCGKWLAHMKKHGFIVKDIVTDEMADIKKEYGMPANLASCHTAIVDGYVVEGHVPAGDVKALLKMKPKIVGISVPGMPAGTPGMEMGGRKDTFRVIAFDKEGEYQIFNSYGDY